MDSVKHSRVLYARTHSDSSFFSAALFWIPSVITYFVFANTIYIIYVYIYHRKNIILTNVTEERFIDPSDYRYRFGGDGDDEKNDNNDDDDGDSSMGSSRRIRVERHISQAMIPGSRLVKAEISQSV
jgi:hypothetical protein